MENINSPERYNTRIFSDFLHFSLRKNENCLLRANVPNWKLFPIENFAKLFLQDRYYFTHFTHISNLSNKQISCEFFFYPIFFSLNLSAPQNK